MINYCKLKYLQLYRHYYYHSTSIIVLLTIHSYLVLYVLTRVVLPVLVLVRYLVHSCKVGVETQSYILRSVDMQYWYSGYCSY
eukprot:COSAG02_NODE_3389_length_6827_cov_2.578627_3_plen_83_part_00